MLLTAQELYILNHFNIPGEIEIYEDFVDLEFDLLRKEGPAAASLTAAKSKIKVERPRRKVLTAFETQLNDYPDLDMSLERLQKIRAKIDKRNPWLTNILDEIIIRRKGDGSN